MVRWRGEGRLCVGENGAVSTQLWACRELPVVVGERDSEDVDERAWTDVTMRIGKRVHAATSVEVGASPWAACGTDRILGPPFGNWGDRLTDEYVYCTECLLIYPIG
jgi:hypothetical protein